MSVRRDAERGAVRLRMFDGFRLQTADGTIALGAKATGLLAVLCAERGAPMARERLATLFWGSHFELQAQQNLRQTLARLRRVLGDALVISRAGVALSPGIVESDLAEFEDGVGDADRARVEAALALYGRGLADAPTIEEDGWRDWLGTQRARLDALAIDARLRMGGLALARGETADAAAHARAAILLDAYREDAHRLLIEALAREGRRAEALRSYDALVADLARELGVAPDPLTRGLAEALRAEAGLAQADARRLSVVAGRALAQDRRAVLCIARSGDGRGRRLVERAFPSARAALAEALSERTRQGARVRIGLHAAPDPSDEEARAAAVRLCDVAQPGDVLLSPDASDVLSPLDAALEDLGDRASPGHEKPVRAFRLAAQAPSDSFAAFGETLLPVVAVLPFTTRGADAAHAALGEALADEIIATLSRSGDVTMISRLTTRALVGRALSPPDLRARLGATYVLSGAVEVAGDRAAVLAELADTRSGAAVWSDRMEAGLGDLFGADGLAAGLLPALVAAILRVEMRRLGARRTMPLEDSTLLLGAIALLHRISTENMAAADEILSELAARAPAHAAPHAWLAMSRVLRASQGYAQDAAAEAEHALASAARALEAEPDCSLALAVEAHVQTYFRRRFDLAQERLSLAVAANPSDALAWLLKSTHHTFRAEGAQAVAAATRARQLSPLDPRRWYHLSLSASAHVAAGAYDEAVRLARQSLAGNRLHASTFRALVIALSLSGRGEEAREAARELLLLQPDLTASGYRARHPVGDTDAGARYAEALRDAGVPP